jgi:hypothetical protein
MLQKMRMSHLRTSEFLGFHKDLLTIVMQNNPEILNVAEPTTVYSGKIAELEALYKTDTFNPITDELVELDHQRDEIFNGILNLLAGHAKHFAPEMRDAGQLLQRDLEKYGTGFVKGNYNAETIDLQNIIADWRNKPELQNATNILGLLDWIAELERVNLLFNSKYIARTGSYAAQPDETATGKRAEVVTAYDVLCNFLNSYAFLNNNVIYRTTISQINALTDQYSVMLKQRRAKAASKKVASPQN